MITLERLVELRSDTQVMKTIQEVTQGAVGLVTTTTRDEFFANLAAGEMSEVMLISEAIALAIYDAGFDEGHLRGQGLA